MHLYTNEPKKRIWKPILHGKINIFRSKLRKKSVRKIALPNFNHTLPLENNFCDQNQDHG